MTGLLRSFSWKGVAALFAFVVALSAWSWFGVLLAGKEFDPGQQLEYFLMLVQRNLLCYFPCYVLVALADGVPVRGPARRVLLAAGLVAGVAIAVQLRCAIHPSQLYYVYYSTAPFCTAFPTWQAYVDFPTAWITPLALGAVVTVFVLCRRRDLELDAALARVRATHLETQRVRIESDLAAMHARIDPDVFFHDLRAIRDRYAQDLEAGEAMLERLIGELRRAARASA